jgi:hypothetical protein
MAHSDASGTLTSTAAVQERVDLRGQDLDRLLALIRIRLERPHADLRDLVGDAAIGGPEPGNARRNVMSS